MTNSDAIRAIINAHIKTNRKQEITGKILNSVLNQMVTDKDAGISEEAKLRAAEDERIEGLINKEIGDRESADAEIQDALTKEVAARKEADTTITNSLSEEKTARQDADTNISNALSDEKTARENADTIINNALSAETSARQEGDTSLLNAIRDAFSKGYLFAGVATTDTNPGTPEGKVFYIANGKGIYTNFGGLEVTDDDDFAIFTYDNAWAKSNVTLSSGGGIAETMVETTYADLKSMRDNGTLTPGMWYRITDYVCTTTQSNTISAGNKFDVIVLATGTNSLSEQARAINHTPQEGETDYFANSNLSAWQIWYCLDNDTNRFTWADATNGKGVIYRMIDEWENDCEYDFKNIMYIRYKLNAPELDSVTDPVQIKKGTLISKDFNLGVFSFIWAATSNQNLSFSNAPVCKPTGESKAFYTFSLMGDNEEVIDLSLVGYSETLFYVCKRNIIKNFSDDMSSLPNVVVFGQKFSEGITIINNYIAYSKSVSVSNIQNTNIEYSNELTADYIWESNIVSCQHTTMVGVTEKCLLRECAIDIFNRPYMLCFYEVSNSTFDDCNRGNAKLAGRLMVSKARNFKILEGTNNGIGSDNLTINFNSNYKGTQYAGLNSSGELKVWYPADCACEPTPSVS